MYVCTPRGFNSLPLRTPVPRLAELLPPAATGLGAARRDTLLRTPRAACRSARPLSPREGLGLGYVATLALQSKPSSIELDH
jgi:hypothetical protein